MVLGDNHLIKLRDAPALHYLFHFPWPKGLLANHGTRWFVIYIKIIRDYDDNVLLLNRISIFENTAPVSAYGLVWINEFEYLFPLWSS